MQMSITTINGMVLVFLSTLCFTTGNVLLSSVGRKVPPLQSAFFRFLVQASISFFSIAVTNRNQIYCISTWMGFSQNFRKIILRSLFGIMAVLSWYSVVQTMPLADATAINYLNIPTTSILAALVLKEPYRFFIIALTANQPRSVFWNEHPQTHPSCVFRPAPSTQ